MSIGLKPPIVLFGNVRSGTTMLQRLFGTHPEVTTWLEPRTVWAYADPRRRHDRFDESDATEQVRRYLRKRFLRYQRRHGNRRIMEKTPSNVMRIPYVAATFPESKFVYIVREPLANLSSTELRGTRGLGLKRTWIRFLETPKTQLHHYVGRYLVDHFRVKALRRRPSYYGVRYPGFEEDRARLTRFELIAKQWVACARQARADLARLEPDRVIHLRYEDFVQQPVDHFGRVLEHVDLRMTREVEQTLREQVDPGRQKKWYRLDREVIVRCLPILEDEMTRQGYAVPDLSDLPGEGQPGAEPHAAPG
ncbi:MAG: sulfotransferase family protein [Planctomycetota bacterium]